MKAEDIVRELEEILEVEPGSIATDAVLNGLDAWDSLAVVSFMAVADEKFGKRLSGKQLEKVGTVADLIKLVESAA